VYELRITFRLGSLEISSRCAKQTLDFRYQRNIELIASESSADEVLSIHIFTRLARMAALERIGHHTGSFSLSHAAYARHFSCSVARSGQWRGTDLHI
jgi:hypothetical protein